jgi:hypothetical protein
MSEEQTETVAPAPKKPSGPAPKSAKEGLGRRTIRKLGRDKRKAKIATDKEFAGKYFASKAKKSDDKKTAFRKKKNKK